MPEFRPISEADRDRYFKAAKMCCTESCEYCFGNLIAWADIYPTEIAFYNGCVLLRQIDGDEILWPVPLAEDEKSLAEGIKLIDSMSLDQTGSHAHIVYISECTKDKLNELFPDTFNFHNHDEFDEYIYTADKFRTYSGKKLHSKKNHYNSFIKTYLGRYVYEPLTEQNADECRSFADEWVKLHDSDEGIGTKNEEKVLETMLGMLNYPEISGGVLRVDNAICGFTIGEACQCNPEMVVVHIEKADDNIRGAYPALASMYIQAHPEFMYVNREEDMGIEGLRKSKLSYYPDRMIKKYSCHAQRNAYDIFTCKAI